MHMLVTLGSDYSNALMVVSLVTEVSISREAIVTYKTCDFLTDPV